jgi:hypothetical protein
MRALPNNTTPEEAYALFTLNQLTSDNISLLANAWLLQGLFTDSLNDLCWETTPIMSTVGPIFEQAMHELNTNKPDRLGAAKTIIKETLSRIVKLEITPEEGASFIYWNIHHEIDDEYPDKDYLGDNLGLEQIFCWLREIWDCKDGSRLSYHTDIPRHEADKKFKEYLYEECEKWLNTH